MKQFQRVSSGLFCLIMLGVVCIQPISAQENLTTQEGERKKMFLSLEEAIQIALENNLDIRVEQLAPEIAREDITNAEADFDSTVSAGSSYTMNETSSDTAADGIANAEIGIGKKFESGGSYELGFESTHSEFDATDVDSSNDNTLSLTLTHPLLKGRGKDINTADIVIAEKNREISVSELRATVINVISQVQETYWDLVLARGVLEADRYSLQLAYDQIKINQAQVDVGTLPPIDILQAKATAASREVTIISDEQSVRDTEDELKRLLNFSTDDSVWYAALIPSDEPISTQQPVSLEENIRLALENREELAQLRKSLEVQGISVNVAENELLPELNIEGSFGLTGESDSWGDSFSNLSDFDTYGVTVGLSFSYPFGNRAAKSSYNKARLEFEQTTLSIQNLEQQVMTEVRQAVRDVETSYKQIEATKVAQELAIQQLDAEQKKFSEGLSTNFQVLEYQDEVASAQSDYTEAITGYNKAIVTLEQIIGVTLQRHNVVIKE